jgi:3-deoxy-D-manno-octulosonate 8-phosphate phosphatase (KDO 8-P phosphatase)
MNNIGDLNFKERLKQIKAFVFDIDGVLSTSNVNIDNNGELVRNTNVKDGYALRRAIEAGFHVGIISGGKSEAVAIRYRNLGISDITINSENKMKHFEEFLAAKHLKPSDVLYMGDDMPDMEVMKICGVATCPADATEDIKGISLFISGKDGGAGCVRDIISQVMKTQNKWYK